MTAEVKADDPRMGSIISTGNDANIVIIGFPFDEGVRRNGGRLGSKQGPEYFRKHLKKMGAVKNAEFNIDLREFITVSDFGDISSQISLEEGHLALKEAVYNVLLKNGIPVMIGGGNDQSFPNALALLEKEKDTNHSIGVINIDAHLDVRPLIDNSVHSGSPFRLLLENPLYDCKRMKFIEFAAQGSQCSAEHVKYLEAKGGEVLWYSQIKTDPITNFERLLNTLGEKIFVSFDIDSIAGRDAPGVSCPATQGLTSEQALGMMRVAGRSQNVVMVDFSELNPVIEDYRTPRLVVNLFYEFCLGVAERKAGRK